MKPTQETLLPQSEIVPYRGEVLVAIVNNRPDFVLAMDKHWYRVPVSSQEKWLKDRWPGLFSSNRQTGDL